jgi:hypothetical protein
MLTLALWAVILIVLYYIMMLSRKAVAMQVLYNQTLLAKPGSKYWLKTLRYRESLHIILKKRNAAIIKVTIVILVAIVILIKR